MRPDHRSAGMAQWWEHSPLTNVARVRFPDSASYVGSMSCTSWTVRGFFHVPQVGIINKKCETGPTVYRPHPRRLESLTIFRRHYKGSTFSSGIKSTAQIIKDIKKLIEKTCKNQADMQHAFNIILNIVLFLFPGNFSYFWIKKDYSLFRLLRMMFRLNFLVVMVMAVTNHEFVRYYVCAMHTYWFLTVYAMLAVFKSHNEV